MRPDRDPKQARRRPRALRPRLEGLETRALLASFTVTTTADSGPGSLRQAILDANANEEADQITFNIPGAGVQTIRPTGELPTLFGASAADPTTIDGTTQPGYDGRPLIELDGSAAGELASGISLSGSGTEVRGLVINRFGNAGVLIESINFLFPYASMTSARVVGNSIGTDPTGTIALGNGRGVLLFSGDGNTIGGTAASDGNLISGNAGTGVEVRQTGTDPGLKSRENLIQGNRIGVDATGAGRLGNGGAGVLLLGSSRNTIGGTAAGAGNVISANVGDGIRLEFFSASSFAVFEPSANLIQGNAIGTDLGNSSNLGNGGGGVVLLQAFPQLANTSANTIGGTASGASNSIRFNGGPGISPPSVASANPGNDVRDNGDRTVSLRPEIVTIPADPIAGRPFFILFRLNNDGPNATSTAEMNVSYLDQYNITGFGLSQGTAEPTTGGFHVEFGSIPAGGSAFAAIQVVTTQANSLQLTASTDDFELNPDDDKLNPILQVSPAPVPITTEIVNVTAVPTGTSGGVIRLDFNGDLDPASAANLANYQIASPDIFGRIDTPGVRPMPISAAGYDPATRSVYLVLPPSVPFFGEFVRVTVGGPGLIDSFGNTLGGDGVPRVFGVGVGAALSYFDSDGDSVQLSLNRGGYLQVLLGPDSRAFNVRLIAPNPTASLLRGSVRRTRFGGDGRAPLGSITGLDMIPPSAILISEPPFLAGGQIAARKRSGRGLTAS